MRKLPFILILLYCFFPGTGSVYGIGEKIIILGADSSWDGVELRQGIAEASRIRPHPVLVLAGAGAPVSAGMPEAVPDLRLSFDESRPGSFRDSRERYDVFVSPALAAAPSSRFGTGATLFAAAAKAGDSLVMKPRPGALFSPDSRIRDFSLEFWLYPRNLENGEEMVSWNSSVAVGSGVYIDQKIQCVTSKNRLLWNFEDFFFSPGGESRKSLTLSGPPVLPRAWSHHLIRFDADLGLLEYLVDGRLEALDYLTSSGREGGDVFSPVTGRDGRFTLGSRFSGMIDEFRVYDAWLEKPVLEKYPQAGGRIESRPLDMGSANSRLLKIETYGGRTSGRDGGQLRNEYAGNTDLRFSDHGAIHFFVRTGGNPYSFDDIPWIPVTPETEIKALPGRYVQIAADFYPGWDGETSPYLAELRILYRAMEPPPPPTQVFATAKNGAVELSWKASPSREVGGYLVYYGTAKGEYFGTIGTAGASGRVFSSPFDAGNRTSIRIEGLNNGTLYFFAVAAYGGPESRYSARFISEPGFPALEPGEFSREAAARPLRMAE